MTDINDRPESGKVYALTNFKNGGPSIAAGNTWAESEVKGYESAPFSIKISAETKERLDRRGLHIIGCIDNRLIFKDTSE